MLIYVVFKILFKKSKPLKKTSFWVTQFLLFPFLVYSIFYGLLYLLLKSLCGPVPEEGLHREFYPDGKPDRLFFIKNGKNEGLYKSWYPNGQLMLYSKYKDGVKIDTSIEYLENGKIKLFEVFKSGKSVHKMEFLENGILYSEIYNSINPNINNYQKDYYENGNLKFQSVSSNLTFKGHWVIFDEKTGKVINQDSFHFKPTIN